MPSSNNRVVLAVAGGRKTESLIVAALAAQVRRTLVTTYTTENLRQIISRICARRGVLPTHLRTLGWFSFLINEAIRPYQHAVFEEIDFVRGLNFEGERSRFAKRGTRPYYLDRNRDIYRGGVSDLACLVNEKTDGAVIRRLEQIFDRIFIDEVQDLVGYDLDFIDLLFKSRIEVTAVGDPRQHTYRTNDGPRNKKYRGSGLAAWLDERSAYCGREDRNVSARCSLTSRSYRLSFRATRSIVESTGSHRMRFMTTLHGIGLLCCGTAALQTRWVIRR
jgi:DNA helicase-2/ATP-dependent DNA helicase PcrA